MAAFNLQDYLENMDERISDRLDNIQVKLDEVSDIKTRVALLERTTSTVTKGLWTLFIAFFGAAFSYLFSLIKAH